MVFFQDWIYGSISDFVSWELYDKLPKSGNVDILGLTNQFRPKIYAAWHLKPRGVNFHTRRYILKRGILENNLDIVKEALDSGADINEEVDQRYGFTPLTLAAMLNRTAVIQYLYLRGANVDKLDRTGNTALMQAVKNWNFESIKLLVENCYSDLKMKDNWGQTAINKANFKNLRAIEVYLMDREAINEENNQIYQKAFQLESQEEANQNTNSKTGTQNKNQKKQSKISKKDLETLEKQVQYKQFPKFSIEFGIENLFKDHAGESLIKNKKIYQAESIRYPFNNFKGTYRVSFLNAKTLDEIIKEQNTK